MFGAQSQVYDLLNFFAEHIAHMKYILLENAP